MYPPGATDRFAVDRDARKNEKRARERTMSRNNPTTGSSVNRRQFISHAAGVSAMAAAAGLAQSACGTPAPASSASGASAPTGAAQSAGQNASGQAEAADAWFSGGRAGRSVVRPGRHGRDEPAAGLAGRHRSPEARRQRGRRRHRHGGDAQRHRAEHDRHRRRRVHAGLFGEDEKAGRAQCQRTRTASAEPRVLHVAEDHARCR